MPDGVSASIHSDEIWEPREKDLKKYIHFDRDIPARKIKSLANDPKSVARNPFFPLLLFNEEFVKYRVNGQKKKKVRPIRYACRRDAAIFAAYRTKLSKAYEAELRRLKITDIPVAYRRIPKPNGGFKCNIEIARDVFEFVRDIGECDVTVVDIKSYFESLDHARIKEIWEILIGSPLPDDHKAVSNAVTNYSVVDVKALFDRLGMNVKGVGVNRTERRKRKIDKLRNSGYRQICSPLEFRQIVAGTNSLIRRNGNDFGIPQGTPISDIIANFYLIGFDHHMSIWASEQGGIYRRYSDDIIVVLPKDDARCVESAKNKMQTEIKKYGARLKIQNKKVAICTFRHSPSGIIFNNAFGASSKNGLEYLGFEFDGAVVKIKSSTLSNAWRKMKRRAYGDAWRYVKRYRAKGRLWLDSNYDRSHMEMILLRNVTFNQDVGYEVWTFVKYVSRASKAFIDFDSIFSRQTQRYRRHAKFVIEKAYNKAIARHSW